MEIYFTHGKFLRGKILSSNSLFPISPTTTRKIPPENASVIPNNQHDM